MRVFGFEFHLPDFLEGYFTDPFQKLVAYTIIYSLIALAQAYTVKTRLHVKKPQNNFNVVLYIVAFFALFNQWGLEAVAKMLVVVGYLITEFIAHRLFHINVNMIYVIESEKCNVIVEDEVFYMRDGKMCVALQDNGATFKRILFGKHVYVEVNMTTKWTEDFEKPLWICNSFEILEVKTETLEESTPTEGARAKITTKVKGFFSSDVQTVLRLDVCDAHEVSRFDLIQKTAILDALVIKYEKLGIAYTKLRTLLTAMLIRKHQNVVLRNLKVFDEAITINETERAEITGIDKQLKEQKKEIDEKKPEDQKQTKQKAKELPAKEVDMQ